MHELGTLICRSFMDNINATGIIPKIYINALLNKLFLFFLFNFIISTMPNKGCVTLTEFVIWFCFSAKYEQNIVIFDIFVVKYGTRLFPIWVLEKLSLVMLLFNQHILILVHLFNDSLSFMLSFCLFQLNKSKNLSNLHQLEDDPTRKYCHKQI